MRQTFYFNTGVKPDSGSPLFGRQIWKDGTKQIPFVCENVPAGARFLFASNDENASAMPDVIVRRILDSGPGGMLSEFAYFRRPKRV